MDFTIEKVPDKPIVMFVPDEAFNLGTGLTKMVEAATTVLDQMEEPVFYIPDMSKARIRLDDMFLGLTQVALGEKPFLRHPKIREILVVVLNPVIKKVAKGVGNGLYGDIPLRTFKTRQEALDYAERQLVGNKVEVLTSSRGSV